MFSSSAYTICMEDPLILMRIQMGLFISVEIFRGKEAITSEELNYLLPALTETTEIFCSQIKGEA